LRTEVGARWTLGRRCTRLDALRAGAVPAGTRFEVTCLRPFGGRCPFTGTRVKVASSDQSELKLTNLVPRRARKFRPNLVLRVRITKPGMIGRVVEYRISRLPNRPRRTEACLRPGATNTTPCPVTRR